MGKILVLYDSKTGHTRQMAEYVAEGVAANPDMEVKLRSVDEATRDDVLWADGIACGTPTYTGLVSWKMKAFWDGIVNSIFGQMDGKIGCAFSSSGGWGGGAELTCLSITIMLMNMGMLIFGVPDYVAPGFTLHHGAVTQGAPREAAIAACRRLGERLAHWVAVCADRQERPLGSIRER